MAKITMKGLEEYERALSRLGDETESIAKKAVYEGAAEVADEFRRQLEELPVEEGEVKGLPPYAPEGKQISVISRRQKGDLLNSLGLAEIENKNGYINTKVGFDGYGSIKTKKHPKGVPNALLARTINSGTSFFKKIPFARKAVNKSKVKAESAIANRIDQELKRIMEE